MLTNSALKNPVAILMVSIAVCVLGYVSLNRIPVDLFPQINIPIVLVGVVYPGAGPKDVEASITQPLERAITSVPNISYIESTSRQGMSIVRAYFDWGANVDVGASDCIQRVQQIMSSLPPGAQQPFVIKMDFSNMAVIGLTLAVGTLDERQLYDLAYNTIQPQLERIPGVATANISGGVVRRINVVADRDGLVSRNLSPYDIVSAISASNFMMPSGMLKVGGLDYNVFTETQIGVVSKIGDIVLKVGDGTGAPVFVRDVAVVEDGGEDLTNIVRVNGGPGVNLWVRKQPGANTIDVVSAVIDAIPHLYGIPAGMELIPTFDQSSYIRKSIQSLVNEALLGALLAISIIFIFLRTFRSTLIIAASIPLSIMATFILLYFLGGQTLNTFTIGGLALGVGRLVDDSIVVLENIFRKRSAGKAPFEAALEGAKEVSMPVLSSTVATIAVFFPVVFLIGITKYLFIPLTLAIAFSLATSYLVAMTLVPILCKRFLKPEITIAQETQSGYNKFLGGIKRAFESIENFYAKSLERSMNHRFKIILLVLAMFIGSLAMTPLVGTDFFPKTDESQLWASIRMPIGTRIEETDSAVRKIEQTITEALGTEYIIALVTDAGTRTSGGGAMWSQNTGPHSASIRVSLVPPENRPFTDVEAVEKIRKKAAGLLPGVRLYFDTGGIVKRIINFGVETPIDIEVIGYDLEQSREIYTKVANFLETVPGVTDVRVTREENYPEFNIRIDREKAALMGLTVRDVAQGALTSITGNLNFPGIFTDPESGKEYQIVVRLKEEDRTRLTDIEDIPLTSRTGNIINLRTVASVEPSAGPVQIDRKYQERIVRVVANVKDRPLGEVASQIERYLDELVLPAGFEVRLTGQREKQQESFRALFMAILLAIMLVYMTVSSQFKSLLEPFIIMFSVPMGLIGVIWTLYLTGTPFSVNAYMGMIMMVGIVLSNGILYVEFANSAFDSGSTVREAVVEAGRVRLRPILMTTLTTLLGLMPMAIGMGEGSETNVPLARAVVGGLASSTVFTLILVPILYTLIKRDKNKNERQTIL